MSLDDLRTRLAELDISIAQQKLVLEDLEAASAVVRKKLDSLVYPVLTLPAEITSEIFFQCLPSAHPHFYPHPLRAPLLLLKVCRTWHSIAASTPRLWSDLNLDVDQLPVPLRTSPAFLAFVTTWLTLARGIPVSFSVVGQIGRKIGLGRLTTILLRHASQMQNITLKVSETDFRNLSSVGKFPLLQKLAIGLPYSNLGGATPIDVFRQTPQLREVSFTDNAEPSMFILPWPQLTNIVCDRILEDRFLQLMSRAPQLVDGTFSVQRQVMFTNMNLIRHTCLQTLHLCDGSGAVLRLLDLPALHTLHLLRVDHIGDSHFLPFLSRSSASLRTFCFGCPGSIVIAPIPVECFSIMAGLTHIEIYGLGTDFLRDFVLRLDRATERGFLPQLQSLVCGDCVVDVNHILSQALSSRCTPHHGLAKLESFRQMRPHIMSWPSGLISTDDLEAVANLRELVGRGMEIYVGTGRRNFV